MVSGLTTDEKARLFGLPVINLRQKNLTYKSLLVIDEFVAEKNRIICFEESEQSIKVAIQDPFNEEIFNILDDIKNRESKIIQLFVASSDDITYALEWYKDNDLNLGKSEMLDREELAKLKISEKEPDNAPPLSGYASIDDILEHAVKSGASEIHIECTPEYARIFYHIKSLHEVAKIPEPTGARLVSQLKEIAKIDKESVHQKGDFCRLINDVFFHLLVTIFPMPVGVRVNIKLEGIEEKRFSLSKLGMQVENVQEVLSVINTIKSGIILVTGSSGSGKTSTMYAMSLLLSRLGKRVATVENSIECFIDGFDQTEVRPKNGYTYASGLKKLSREGYDVIVVDGLRDLQTTSLVIDEAKKGKIIIVPFNDLTISGAIHHLEELGAKREDIIATLKLVINQRLLLRLCPNCRIEQKLDVVVKDELSQEIKNLPKASKHSNIKVKEYMHSGCSSCNETGFSGHVGIFEVLLTNSDVEEAISKGTIGLKEKEIMRTRGLVNLRQDGIIKVSEGVTTIDEIERVL